MRYSAIASLAVALILGACTGSNHVIETISSEDIDKVHLDIKRQIAVYQSMAPSRPVWVFYKEPGDKTAKLVNALDLTTGYACGKSGMIDFDVTQVTANLLVQSLVTNGVEAGLSPSFSGATLSVSGKFSVEDTRTQSLVYNLWPKLKAVDIGSSGSTSKDSSTSAYLSPSPELMAELKASPIAEALLNLRESLIRGALNFDPNTGDPRYIDFERNIPWSHIPCFQFFNKSKAADDAGNVFSFGIGVVKTSSASVGLKVVILSIGASSSKKSTRTSTVAVKFIQHQARVAAALFENKQKLCGLIDKMPATTSTEDRDAAVIKCQNATTKFDSYLEEAEGFQ